MFKHNTLEYVLLSSIKKYLKCMKKKHLKCWIICLKKKTWVNILQPKDKHFKNEDKNSIIGFMMLAPFFFCASILECFLVLSMVYISDTHLFVMVIVFSNNNGSRNQYNCMCSRAAWLVWHKCYLPSQNTLSKIS